jgi:hypothetical protein
MSLLAYLWVFSLLTLVAVTLFAYRRSRFVAIRHVPHDLGEFIHEALSHIATGVSSTAATLQPHARKVTLHVVTAGKWGHDRFIDRVFGKRAQLPGRTASFFLKYIAEHKEGVRGTPEQRAGLEK